MPSQVSFKFWPQIKENPPQGDIIHRLSACEYTFLHPDAAKSGRLHDIEGIKGYKTAGNAAQLPQPKPWCLPKKPVIAQQSIASSCSRWRLERAKRQPQSPRVFDCSIRDRMHAPISYS